MSFSLSYAPSQSNSPFSLRKRVPRYPIKPFKTGDEARNLLSKIAYERDENMLDFIRYSLSHLIEERPSEAYSIAIDMRQSPRGTVETVVARSLEDIARAAARNSLLHPPPDPWAPWMGIKLAVYDRFTDYRSRCLTRLLKEFEAGRVARIVGIEWVWYSPTCATCPIWPRDRWDRDSPQPGLVAPDRVYPTVWWARYWERLLYSVDDFPCEKPFKYQLIRDVTMRELAQECPKCHKKAVKEFPRFRKILVNEVTTIVDEVCILL